ncbi:DUF4914 family protein [Chakrabartyella piscis]|uniref:DUF4914 family protein n=1 Tax=Chakrabartyella piscis TaxID=2918914 RepID=UPI00295891DF|nr:DUF4914 family protein [Chakrabartyella piscis]
MNKRLSKIAFTDELMDVLWNSPNVVIPASKKEFTKLTFGSYQIDVTDISYEVGDKNVLEATVTRCKNGIAVNYTEDYMRRRDPECMLIGDKKPTNKTRFSDRYPQYEFENVRKETLDWLSKQELIVVPFLAGTACGGYDSLLVCPLNAAFFAAGLANLQTFVNIDELDRKFEPRSVIFLAPPFRHTHFDGAQIVVHNRCDHMHELFAYNLYPGPSAKKGVYGVLLNIGEEEGWITAHASAVQIITPYENEVVIMHEGASGGGKSEMLEEMHRETGGELLLGINTLTKERNLLNISEACSLHPICDDMALCHPSFQSESGKLVIADAEDGWFLRVDHITHYGTDHQYEKISIHPDEPLVFFNIQGQPNSTCLIWEHTLDSTGEPCPNPRVIIPRKSINNIITEPIDVDIRSFGVRMPPSSNDMPNYGIMGLFHIIPPALAWLWRLVAPRGHKNPSIVDDGGMTSEGVGSYYPFATGEYVLQANMLLDQIMSCPNTNYILVPNQHVGIYKVGFSAEWIAREYLARRGGARFYKKNLLEARCPLLGYTVDQVRIDGQRIRSKFLRTETQDSMGIEGYDKGAKILHDFFVKELEKFDVEELHPVGKQIIECFRNGGTMDDYCDIIPMDFKK